MSASFHSLTNHHGSPSSRENGRGGSLHKNTAFSSRSEHFPSPLLSTLRSLKITGGRDSANKKKKIFRVVFHFTNFHFNCSQSRPSPSFVFHFFICSLRASSKMLRVKSASSFVIHIGGLMRKTFFSFLLCSSHANMNF